MSRKLTSIMLTVAILCGMLGTITGCASSGGSDKLVLALRSGTYADVIKACLPDFEAEHGITCEVLELSEDDLHSYVLNDSVRGK